jgi:DNA invertase Pin-like site-specific DNA recombinase
MTKSKKGFDRPNAVIYCRVSTDEQVENLSLGIQQQRSITYCSQNGWPVAEVFRDEGTSAKTTQREQFQRMLRYCANPPNRVGYVVVNDLSRFSRNANDLTTTRAVLLASGVLLRSVTESIDETSTGNFITTIFGAVHQLSNDVKSELSKTGMQAAAAMGRWPHKAPLGYLNMTPFDDGPNITPDPKRAELVRKAFDLAATGLHSQAEILRIVGNLGLDTTKGKPLSMQTFQKMLLNPFYAGLMVFPTGGVRMRGSFEPLVSQELFDKVQDVIAGRRPKLTGYQRNHPDFPLRVFVRCSKCGVPLTGSWSSGRKKKYPYYRCRKNCDAVQATPEKLHTKFLEWLEHLAPSPDSMESLTDTIRAVWKERRGDAERLRLVLKRKLTEVETRRSVLVDRWLDGKVDQKTYDGNIGRLTAEIESIGCELIGTELDDIELERVLDFAEKIILRPSRLWVESSLEQRQRLQKTLFPDGIEFDGEEFGTASTSLFFHLLEVDLDDSYGLASPTGFEPVLSP